jgi:lysozyme
MLNKFLWIVMLAGITACASEPVGATEDGQETEIVSSTSTEMEGGVAATSYLTDLTHRPAQGLVEQFGTSAGITEETGVRPLLPIALDLIKDFEGWVAKPYNDAVGYCTIGYGHLIDLASCAVTNKIGPFLDGLTYEAGLELLREDTIGIRQSVQEMVKVETTPEQFGALTSFAFNVGPSKLRRSTLLRLLNEGYPDLAAKQFGRWTYAGGVELPGLITRRSCESALFTGALQYDAQGQFSRSQCVAAGVAASVGEAIDIEVGE